MSNPNELVVPPKGPWTGPDPTRSPTAITFFATLVVLGAVALLLAIPSELPRLVRQSAIMAVVTSVVLTTVGAVEHGASPRVFVRALVIYAVMFFAMRLAIDGLFVATDRYVPAQIQSWIPVAIVVSALGVVLVASVRELRRASRPSE